MRPSAPPYLHRFRLEWRRSLMTHAPRRPGFRDAALSDDSGASPLFAGFRVAARSDDSRASLCRLPGRGCVRRRRETGALRRLGRGVGRLHGGGRRGVPVNRSRWSGEAEWRRPPQAKRINPRCRLREKGGLACSRRSQ